MGSDRLLTKIVVTNYSKLMACKDEYGVARQYTRPEFRQKLKETFEGNVRLAVNLAPPLISRRDKETGRPIKREFGSWVFPILSVIAKL
ncbi:MAG: indolepyruvate ferredoxin oxidoreductase [Gammaproteobacteria bacterium]|jgi:indolepyruvate ferredoxin oxidoreductase